MSSIEPCCCGGEIYGAQEVAGGLIIARGDGSELFEKAEEVLDQVSLCIDCLVEFSGHQPTGFRRYHERFSSLGQPVDHPLISVVGSVGDERLALHARQQLVGTGQIVGVAAGQADGDWPAESIDQRVDLGAQTAAGAAYRLVGWRVFFAPALC